MYTSHTVLYLHIYFYVSRILTQSQVGPADIWYGPRIFSNEIHHRQTSFALVVARSDTRCLHTSARDTSHRFRRARRANRLLLPRVCACEFLSRYVLVIETARKTPINGMTVCRLWRCSIIVRNDRRFWLSSRNQIQHFPVSASWTRLHLDVRGSTSIKQSRLMVRGTSLWFNGWTTTNIVDIVCAINSIERLAWTPAYAFISNGLLRSRKLIELARRADKYIRGWSFITEECTFLNSSWIFSRFTTRLKTIEQDFFDTYTNMTQVYRMNESKRSEGNAGRCMRWKCSYLIYQEWHNDTTRSVAQAGF